MSDFPLHLTWVCSSVTSQQANYKLVAIITYSFPVNTFGVARIQLQCPESELTLHCKDLKVKV